VKSISYFKKLLNYSAADRLRGNFFLESYLYVANLAK